MESTTPNPSSDSGKPLASQQGPAGRALLLTLGVLIILRLLVGFLQVPAFLAPSLSLVFSAIFIAIPIIGLFYAAQARWGLMIPLALIGIGVVLQVSGTPLAQAATLPGWARLSFQALAQSGLILWCFGLGASLAALFNDKNLLLPVSVFLAGFDVFLVTMPSGPVQQVLQRQPEIFQNVAYAVPAATKAGQAVGVQIGAYVGPADFIFLSMFFVALYQFQMRIKQTLPWMVAALVGYLGVVLLLGDVQLGPISLAALPALLPIGLVVLLVNFPEFKLSRDEWIGTVVVGILAVALATFGIQQQAKHQERLRERARQMQSQPPPSATPNPTPNSPAAPSR